MKRTFGECFGGDDDLMEDEEEEEEEEDDWKAPVKSDEDEGSGYPNPKAKKARHQDGNNDHHRTIVHIDLDCFYAQVEMLRNPSLRDKPLGIQQKNIVVTTNYVAREYGVGKLAYIKDALQKCPDLVLVSGEDLTHYRETSYKVTEIIQRFDPTVERLGFDENFIDVSSLVEERFNKCSEVNETSVFGHMYKEASIPACLCGCHQRLTIGSHIAMEMRQALHKELGLTSCAGVAHNKLLAKLVGGQHKPNNQTTIFPEHAEQLVINLGKVTRIPGIGHSTGKRLASMGISTIQHLQDASQSVLESEFGHQQACTMQQLAHGIDNTPVTATGAPQSLSDEDSFKKCSTVSDAKERMLGMLGNLIKRLKSDGRLPQTIRVTVRKYSTKEWKRESRQCSLALGIFKSLDKDEGLVLTKLLDVCIGLFQKMVDITRPFHLTLINICFAKMQSKTSSGSLDNFFTPKTASSRTSSLTKLSEASGSAHSSDISVAKTSHEHGMNETVGVNKEVPDEKEKPGTLVAFFFSPKHNTTKTSQLSMERHSGNVSSLAEDTDCTQTNSKKVKTNSLDRFLSHESASSSSHSVETIHTVPRPIFRQTNVSTSLSKEHKAQSSESATHVEELRESCSNRLSDTTVPPNIDPDVFAQLPPDLQQELRTEFASSVRGQFPGAMMDDNHVTLASKHQESCVNGPTSSGQVSELTGVTGPQSEEPQPSRPPAGAICIPPDVDPEVFAGLPHEMQQELANEWKRKASQSNQSSLTDVGHKSHGHSKEKVKQKGKSISDYFKK